MRKTKKHIARWTLRAALGVAAVLLLQAPPSFANGENHAFCAKAEVTAVPLPAGQMRLTALSPCLTGGRVHIEYAGFQFVAPFDLKGRMDYVLDCFAGDKSAVAVIFPNGERDEKPVVTRDLEQISKVAVVWRGEVNLDLHAFEYAAGAADAGHVWQGAPSNLRDATAFIWADRRGHGFISAVSGGLPAGDQVEVYTFLHAREQTAGVVKMALDYASRYEAPPNKESCGTGLFSELEYQVLVLARGRLTKSSGVFNTAPCGETLENAMRYNVSAMGTPQGAVASVRLRRSVSPAQLRCAQPSSSRVAVPRADWPWCGQRRSAPTHRSATSADRRH